MRGRQKTEQPCVSLEAPLVARIAAALAFATAVATAAVANPAMALMLLAIAAGGVILSQTPTTVSRGFGAGALGFGCGIGAVGAVYAVFGLAAGLTALVIWRAFAEAFAAESHLRHLARRGAGDPVDRGWVRLWHLSAGPIFALALVFGLHGGAVFGIVIGSVPMSMTIVLIAAACVALLDWAIRRLADWRLGIAGRAIALHVGGHHAMFFTIALVASDAAALLAGLTAWRILRFAPPLPGQPEAPPASQRPSAKPAQVQVLAR
jgi:hypothetical protein